MSWDRVPLQRLLKPVVRPVSVVPGTRYRLLGVQWYAKGLFVREEKDGSEIRAQTLYQVSEGLFVYNRLFAWKGSFALATESDAGGFVSNEFPCFEIDRSAVEPGWLCFYFSLEAVWNEALAGSSGGTPTSRNRLKEDRFLAMEIPLPTLPEQRRIAGRLNAFEEKREAVETLVKAVEGQSAVLWSSCARYLLRGLERFERCRLGDLVEVLGGGTPSTTDPTAWTGSIPWISPKDMKTAVIQDSLDHISEAAARSSPAKPIEAGAVLIVVRGMILARAVPVALLAVRAAINQDMKALVPAKALSAAYLAWYLRAHEHGLLDLVERSTHDTRKLQTNKLLDYPVLVPPARVQQEVVAQLERLDKQNEEMRRTRLGVGAEVSALKDAVLQAQLGAH